MTTESEKQNLKVFMVVLAVIALCINFWFYSRESFSTFSSQPGQQAVTNENVNQGNAQRVRAEQTNLLAKYFDTTFIKSPGVQTIALSIATDSGKTDRAIQDALIQHFKSGNVKILPSFFKPAFITNGLFENTFNGSGDVPAKLELGKYLDALLLAREHVEISQNSAALDNVLTATIRLDVAIVLMADNLQSKTWTFTANGAGFKPSDAQVQAEERILKQVAAEANMSLK
jgi:hypothetical protein